MRISELFWALAEDQFSLKAMCSNTSPPMMNKLVMAEEGTRTMQVTV